MNHNFDNPNNLTESELIRLVQCRDEAAFTELISQYSPRIWNIVLDKSRQKRDAEEILMDIWLAVWQNIIGLRKVESFGAWLRKIANNACNRYYASKENKYAEIILSYEDLADQIDRESEQLFQSGKLQEEAREAVNHLPQKVRSIAQMYYLDLSSVKEIANEFNLPIGTVKSKLSETRKLLQKEFEIKPKEEESMTQRHAESKTVKTICKIIGVGGEGCSAVKQLVNRNLNDIELHVDEDIDRNTDDIELYAVDMDIESLKTCNEITRIQIGEKRIQGKGTDGILDLGRRATAESIDRLHALVADVDTVITITALGEGTGTFIEPIIESITRSKKTMNICFATQPLDEAGQYRIDLVKQGIFELIKMQLQMLSS